MRSELGAMPWNCRPAHPSHRIPPSTYPNVSFEIIGASVVVGFDERRYCCDAGPHLPELSQQITAGTTALSARYHRTPTTAPALVVFPVSLKELCHRVAAGDLL